MSDYYAGKECTCHAYAKFECACNADWTDPEIYKLRDRIEELEDVSDWIVQAYARLGAVRDAMTPEEVATIQKFLGPLSVKKFGAVGDGQTDDSAAIQRASDFVADLKSTT